MIFGQLQVSFHALMKDEIRLGQQETEAFTRKITALEETNNNKATDLAQLSG